MGEIGFLVLVMFAINLQKNIFMKMSEMLIKFYSFIQKLTDSNIPSIKLFIVNNLLTFEGIHMFNAKSIVINLVKCFKKSE